MKSSFAPSWRDTRSGGGRTKLKLEQMVLYGQSTTCRWNTLLTYFEEATDADFRCGTCDACRMQQSHAA